jgi:aryl-alcohol dehydrogenase-like predicted oxidoreductase
LAVAWVGGHPAVTAPIVGARNVAQLEGSLGALDIDMTPDLRDAISALSMEPPLATDRAEERTGDKFSALLTKR